MQRPDDAASPRTLRALAVVASVAASATISLVMLDLTLRPLDVPTAMVFGALFLQPALLLILPKRRISLDLAAGVLAALLGAGLIFIPYALMFPWATAVAVFSIIAGIFAICLNSYSKSKGDAVIAVLAVVLTITAMSAVAFDTQDLCRYGYGGEYPEFVCADGVSYLGAVATVGALGLASFTLWLSAGRCRFERVTRTMTTRTPSAQ